MGASPFLLPTLSSCFFFLRPPLRPRWRWRLRGGAEQSDQFVEGIAGESFANIDQTLRKEFCESEQTNGETDPGGFNKSGAEEHAVLETVARVSSKKNDTKEKLFQFHVVFNLDNENLAEDAPTVIDWKVKISCTAVRLEVDCAVDFLGAAFYALP